MTAKHILFAVALAPIGCSEPLPEDEDEDSGAEEEGDEGKTDSEEDEGEAPAEDCEFVVQNGLDFGGYLPAIFYLYISPSGASSWGDDQLGSNTLDYGDSVNVSGVPAGFYDVRVSDQDGDTYTLWDVECTGGEWFWRVAAYDLD